jgi:hypothetical protein
MKFLVSPITLVTLLVLSTVPLQAESRAWSNREGKAIQAEFVTYDSETKKVTLKLSNGNKATLALDALSDSDQSWLTDRQTKRPQRSGPMPARPLPIDPTGRRLFPIMFIIRQATIRILRPR